MLDDIMGSVNAAFMLLGILVLGAVIIMGFYLYYILTDRSEHTLSKLEEESFSSETVKDDVDTAIYYEGSGDVVMGDKYEYNVTEEVTEKPVVDNKYEAIGKYSVAALAIIMLGAYLIVKAVLKHNKEDGGIADGDGKEVQCKTYRSNRCKWE